MSRPAANSIVVLTTLLVVVCTISCGDSSQKRQTSASTETQEHGDVAVKLNWHTEDEDSRQRKSSDRALVLLPDGTLDCEASNVATIYVAVFDQQTNDQLADNNDGWDCTDHHNILSDVPVGNQRKVVVLGLNANGQALVRGEQQNVVVVGNSSPADATSVSVDMNKFATPPQVDTPSSAAATHEIQWEAFPEAKGYEIQVADDATFSNVLTRDFVTDESYTAGSFTTSGTYYCRIRPVDSVGLEGAWSEIALTVLIPPIVTATEVEFLAATRARLKGTINPNGAATTYYFEYGLTTAYGNHTPQQTVDGGSAEVSVDADIIDLSQDETYHYRLVASNGEGIHIQSDDQTFSTRMAPPEAPTLLTVSTDSTQMELTWLSVPNATRYTIYWDTHSGVTQTEYSDKIENITTTHFVHQNRTSCNWYHYVVTAHNAWGESEVSNERKILFPQTDYYVAPPPSGVAANNGFTPDTPVVTIQQALDTVETCAQQYPVTIHVAGGKYTEKVKLKSPITLEGGWNHTFIQRWDFETNTNVLDDNFETVIDCDDIPDAPTKPCVTIDREKAPVSISGITLLNNGENDSAQGRAIHNINSALEVNHCRFYVYIDTTVPAIRNDSSHPTVIQNCNFFPGSHGATRIHLRASEKKFYPKRCPDLHQIWTI